MGGVGWGGVGAVTGEGLRGAGQQGRPSTSGTWAHRRFPTHTQSGQMADPSTGECFPSWDRRVFLYRFTSEMKHVQLKHRTSGQCEQMSRKLGNGSHETSD